ncbi:MAG TPA: hypothetical protein VNM48_14720 [Chloroflexota bacterium]|nr:hypothetical protein [Chloroflexota bacterium]
MTPLDTLVFGLYYAASALTTLALLCLALALLAFAWDRLQGIPWAVALGVLVTLWLWARRRAERPSPWVGALRSGVTRGRVA